MQSPSIVRAVAALTSRRVTVLSGGKSYELPLKPPPAKVEPPDPLEVMAKKLLERDAETRATVASVAARADETLNAVKEAVAGVAAGHAEVVESMRENTRTLHLPVRPRYDADGKVVEAQRVQK